MRKPLFILVIFMILTSMVWPCSSAVVSGRSTPDGRPLIWKHRDARDEENDLRYFEGEKYSFIGLVNTKDEKGEQVWMGGNSEGFCIMNTNAYNLDKAGYDGPMDQDGYFMKEALGKCANLQDLEKLLDEKQGKLGVIACFGAIDAQGGAAYYETSPFKYVKYNAADSRQAPSGYLIRTNFGFSGKMDRGSGYIRYRTLTDLFFRESVKNKITAEFLVLDATRCLEHTVLKTNLRKGELPGEAGESELQIFRDYIVRGGSVSSMIARGVKPGEDPLLTTLWYIPAFQLSSPVVPVWAGAGKELPEAAVSRNGEPSFISEKALSLKSQILPLPGWEGRNYIDLPMILNQQGNGILQELIPQDRMTLSRSLDLVNDWKKNGFKPSQAADFYDRVDERIREFYKNIESNFAK